MKDTLAAPSGATIPSRSIATSKARVLAITAVLFLAAFDGLAQEKFEDLPQKLPPGSLLETSKAVLPQGTSVRPVYAKGLALTKVSEGWVNKLYNDSAGYCTVGYGHLIKMSRCDGSEPARFMPTISEALGEELLVEDMQQAQIAVMLAVKVPLTDGQYAALCDFTFNVGGANLRSSTLLKVINDRQFDRVPAQLRRWTLAGGQEFPGLVTRREREIELFFDGLPIPKAVPQPGEDLAPIDVRRGQAS